MAAASPDRSGRSADRRIDNVSLFRRGKTEHGSLVLSRFHLTFTSTPDATRSSQRTTTPAAREPSAPHASQPVAEGGEGGGDGTKPPDQAVASHPARPPAKAKTVWIGYPMINHCVLRPSHAQHNDLRSRTAGPDADAREMVNDNDHDDDLFPPTFGTSTYERPSTDSARFTPVSSPARPASPAPGTQTVSSIGESGRPPAIRLRCRDFRALAFHFHPSATDKAHPDELARQVFFELRQRCCVNRIQDLLAFSFHPPKEEIDAAAPPYDARREFGRMGIGAKAAEGPGSAWRISDINRDYSFSPTYPATICVPRAVSDNMLKYGGVFRSRARVPCLAYLHFNGGSITRSSQPLVGVQGKRNPQDERLVSAIFSSHTPSVGSADDTPDDSPSHTPGPLTSSSVEFDGIDAVDESTATAAPDTSKRKIYGSTRRNYIVDARPKMNVLANRATGGGIEDVANYMGAGDALVEKVYLNIANIHVMRASLEKVVESLGNSDYVDLAPAQESLRKSGWLGHIAGLLEGADLVARVVGLGGSHALIHCSDGWDRTSQVSALAQVLLDPHYRTLRGFVTLVQKDFLSFGHKFRDRSGIQGSEKWFEIENERITPAKASRRDNPGNQLSDSNGLNVLSAKALTGARNWFEKNRSSLFRQQNSSRENVTEGSAVSPSPPPPNSVIHAPVAATTSKDSKKHETKSDEIAPIFHQFLDALYQLLRQKPSAFEFNEKFLLRLLYQSYSTQYGEFLFNHEQERTQHAGETPSVWAHFLARNEFVNPNFDPSQDSLLLPERSGPDRQIDVRWWHKLFGREDHEMNQPQHLAMTLPHAPPVPTFSAQTSEVRSGGANLDYDPTLDADRSSHGPRPEGRSSQTLERVRDTLASSLASVNLGVAAASSRSASQSRPTPPSDNVPPATRPDPHREETDPDALARYVAAARPPSADAITAPTEGARDALDPLGVLSSPNPGATDALPSIVASRTRQHAARAHTEKPNTPSDNAAVTSTIGTGSGSGSGSGSTRQDFATFASQNAFQDR